MKLASKNDLSIKVQRKIQQQPKIRGHEFLEIKEHVKKFQEKI